MLNDHSPIQLFLIKERSAAVVIILCGDLQRFVYAVVPIPIIITGYLEIMLQVGNVCQQRVLQLHKPVETILASFIQSHSVTSSYTSSLADHSRYRNTIL